MIADEDSRLRGVGGEIQLILLEFAFSFKEINRVTAPAASDNKIACRTLESVGYKKYFVKINEFPLKSGEKCDVNGYRMLRDEWNERKQDLKYSLEYIHIS